ncbi:hypothetical protein BH10CYA1_BH10CYA1_07840 [soil metagenome]
MTISTRAATAAGFALTLMLSVNCNYVSAQQTADASTYQTPSAATASMVDTPAAPQLQGASCGTIGPQGGEEVLINYVAEDKTTISGESLMAGKFDGLLFLRSFSSDINQFKGKIAEKAFSFVESLQSTGSKEPAVVAPSGYKVIRQPATVSPTVF